MKEYLANQIRNVAILGHMGCGKTTLCESALFLGKAISKKGEIEKKNTVSDYMVEEQARQTSLSTSLIPIEWKGCKINFLDTPGSEEFAGEIEQVLSVVKGAVICIDATKGIEVGTQRYWEQLRENNIPTIIFINKMNKENVKFEKVMNDVINYCGPKAIPICWPVGKENDFQGFINCVLQKAWIKGQVAEVPAELQEKHDELHYQLSEKVAETSEGLMEKFFGGEPLTEGEFNTGLRASLLGCDLYPIVVGNTIDNTGVEALLDMVVEYLPNPTDLKSIKGSNPKTGEQIVRHSRDNEPFSAYIFKTVVDPFLGTVSYFKVYSGSTLGLNEVYIPNTDQTAKLASISSIMGKTLIPVDVLHAGDIGVVSKVGELETGFTICDRKSPILYEPVAAPTPVMYVAIKAKTKNDEDKMSNALQKLNLEDPTFEIRRNPETQQLLLGGAGTTHIGYIIDKMKNMFKVEVELEDPKIVYRETIRKVGSAQGRHKKQSGGAGQFGDVWIRFEPSEVDFEFASEVVGGAVPKNYFPAVEKGLQDCLEHGPLAGFPVIGVRAVLYDGSYHPVDSNEISFKLAAALAFKEASKIIKPTILEPIMEVKVVVDNDYVGDVMGDMNKRRGQVLGIDPLPNGKQEITATVPEAEIIKYATDLKAMTQASGHFSRKFIRYDDVPEHLVPKIIAEYKKEN